MLKSFRTSVIYLLFTVALSAQFDGGTFLDARALGMGGALAALGDDGNAVIENPAALGSFSNVGFGVMGSPMFLELADGGGIVNFTGHFILPLGFLGTTGLAVKYFNVSEFSYGGTIYQTFESALSYGYTLPIPIHFFELGVGASGLLRYWNVPAESVGAEFGDLLWSLTFDLNVGAYLKLIDRIGISFVFANILGPNTSRFVQLEKDTGLESDVEESMPRELQLGASYDFRGRMALDYQISLVLDEIMNMNMALGGELIAFETVAFRVGVALDDMLSGSDFLTHLALSAGLGYQVKGFSLDLAYTHRISDSAFGSAAMSLAYAFETKSRITPPSAEKRAKRKRNRESEYRESAKKFNAGVEDVEEYIYELELEANRIRVKLGEPEKEVVDPTIDTNTNTNAEGMLPMRTDSYYQAVSVQTNKVEPLSEKEEAMLRRTLDSLQREIENLEEKRKDILLQARKIEFEAEKIADKALDIEVRSTERTLRRKIKEIMDDIRVAREQANILESESLRNEKRAIRLSNRAARLESRTEVRPEVNLYRFQASKFREQAEAKRAEAKKLLAQIAATNKSVSNAPMSNAVSSEVVMAGAEEADESVVENTPAEAPPDETIVTPQILMAEADALEEQALSLERKANLIEERDRGGISERYNQYISDSEMESFTAETKRRKATALRKSAMSNASEVIDLRSRLGDLPGLTDAVNLLTELQRAFTDYDPQEAANFRNRVAEEAIANEVVLVRDMIERGEEEKLEKTIKNLEKQSEELKERIAENKEALSVATNDTHKADLEARIAFNERLIKENEEKVKRFSDVLPLMASYNEFRDLRDALEELQYKYETYLLQGSDKKAEKIASKMSEKSNLIQPFIADARKIDSTIVKFTELAQALKAKSSLSEDVNTLEGLASKIRAKAAEVNDLQNSISILEQEASQIEQTGTVTAEREARAKREDAQILRAKVEDEVAGLRKMQARYTELQKKAEQLAKEAKTITADSEEESAEGEEKMSEFSE